MNTVRTATQQWRLRKAWQSRS